MEFRAKGDPKVCPVLITLKLSHVSMDCAMLNCPDQEQGDILVMDGDDIQKHYL